MLLAEHGHDWWPIWPILWLAVIVGGRLVPEPPLAPAGRRPPRRCEEDPRRALRSGELTYDEYQERLTQLG